MSINLPSRRLVSQEDQSRVERPDIPRSTFQNTWFRNTTFDAGYLVPIMVDEVLPGDYMKYNVTAYVRMSTLLFPMFDNQRVDTFFFFVPARLLWYNWARFMGEQDSPTDSIAYTIPVMEDTAGGGEAAGSMSDHFGLPVAGQITASTGVLKNINALPFRAYNLVWKDWFRDENLQNTPYINNGNGPDPYASYPLRRRGKFHDYFTSCLPWPQKFTAPTLGLIGNATVHGLGIKGDTALVTTPASIVEPDGSTPTYAEYYRVGDGSTNSIFALRDDPGSPGGLYADLSSASGATINELRRAFLVQQLLERDARGGTRYTEKVKMHFGVTNPDFRLQRPEYIGGGSSPLNVTPVAQTATGGGGVGALAAAGTAAGNHSASYAATEHGYIIGLINVRTELSYSQGLHRMWTRSVQTDFAFPSLAGLGEQAVLRKEIYCIGDDGTSDDVVFGYQERYHEYRTRTSEVVNEFRPTTANAIDQWHLSEEFGTAPTLGDTFIQDTPPVSRVIAASTAANGQQYLANILFQRTATRALPAYGTPVSLGRF